ncbi:MAG: NUDIX domain-containing protein [Calditrichaeota bacterium]|nr:MAG: NUDIX domain-containing protein [Calditrichota bacterium]
MNQLHRDFKFCPKCAGALTTRILDSVERLVCSKCGFIFYLNPTPAVAVLLLSNGQVLLVKRKYEPRSGYWSLPAGFVEYYETVQETAIREVKEETNLDIQLRNIYGVYSAHDDPRNHVVLIVYWGEILGGQLKAGDDAIEAKFFTLDNLPEDIAFKTHRQILQELKQSKCN